MSGYFDLGLTRATQLREQQIQQGFTDEHDDTHTHGELLRLAGEVLESITWSQTRTPIWVVNRANEIIDGHPKVIDRLDHIITLCLAERARLVRASIPTP